MPVHDLLDDRGQAAEIPDRSERPDRDIRREARRGRELRTGCDHPDEGVRELRLVRETDRGRGRRQPAPRARQAIVTGDWLEDVQRSQAQLSIRERAALEARRRRLDPWNQVSAHRA